MSQEYEKGPGPAPVLEGEVSVSREIHTGGLVRVTVTWNELTLGVTEWSEFFSPWWTVSGNAITQRVKKGKTLASQVFEVGKRSKPTRVEINNEYYNQRRAKEAHFYMMNHMPVPRRMQ